MATKDLGFIKDEIAFYMEKIFQFSYAYVGAVIVVIAGSKTEVLENLSDLLLTESQILISTMIIFLNLVYLIIACSSSYAILKRGYFILSQNNKDGIELYIDWEKYNRSKGVKQIDSLSWNIDNFYTLFIFAICFIFSIILFSTTIRSSSGVVRIFQIALMLFHLFPIWAIFQISRLNKLCTELSNNWIFEI